MKKLFVLLFMFAVSMVAMASTVDCNDPPGYVQLMYEQTAQTVNIMPIDVAIQPMVITNVYQCTTTVLNEKTQAITLETIEPVEVVRKTYSNETIAVNLLNSTYWTTPFRHYLKTEYYRKV